jgi:hypothetical protein
VIRLKHDNNVMEFSSEQAERLLEAVESVAREERGMVCVLSCLLAARDYFESGRASRAVKSASLDGDAANEGGESDLAGEGSSGETPRTSASKIRASAPERIKECNVQGLAIAESILNQHQNLAVTSDEKNRAGAGGKGGSWTYTIGLVGKPSVRS